MFHFYAKFFKGALVPHSLRLTERQALLFGSTNGPEADHEVKRLIALTEDEYRELTHAKIQVR